jgi:hypothetical protein
MLARTIDEQDRRVRGLPPSSDELTSDTPADPDPADSGAVVGFVVASAKVCSGGSPYFEETATRGLPIFDDLADPAVVARLAVRPHSHTACPPPVAQGRQGNRDAGPAQRRPPHARRRSRQRSLRRRLCATGEDLDDRRRGQMLDESLEILAAAWSGRAVHHHSRHYTVDGISFLPRPVQRPGVPVWAAGLPGNVKPLRRAARHDGFLPVNLEHPDQLADIVTTITGLRQRKTTRYDIAVALPPSADPAPYAKAGATWWLAESAPETVSLDQVRGVLRDGPVEIGIERIR